MKLSFAVAILLGFAGFLAGLFTACALVSAQICGHSWQVACLLALAFVSGGLSVWIHFKLGRGHAKD